VTLALVALSGSIAGVVIDVVLLALAGRTARVE